MRLTLIVYQNLRGPQVSPRDAAIAAAKRAQSLGYAVSDAGPTSVTERSSNDADVADYFEVEMEVSQR